MFEKLRDDSRRNKSPESPNGERRPTIMIADDDSALVQVLSIRCKQMGLDVFRSPDAMHALLGAHRVKPDLMILDINMPGGNGLSVCEMIVSDKTLADTTVIVMSGESDESITERCERLGARYVRKGPHLWEDLQAVIIELMESTPQGEGTTPQSNTSQTCDEHPVALRPKVLCIDDDPEITQVLKLRLERHGVDVVRAFNGMQGFWTAVDERPDVVICDMNMPEGEGNYVNGRLKTHPVTKDVPVIILTGQANPALKRQMFSLGVAAYLDKPVRFDELLEVLRKYITLKDPAAQLAKT